ncbi:MAG: hypothetical protein ACOCQY_02115 [Halorhabdus sp.]
MATNTNTETMADKIAMALGGGFILLGVVVLGIIETLAGEPTSPIADGAAAEGVLIDPAIRQWILLIGIVVLGLFAIYAFATQQHLGE